jgi:hypothetical protein
LSFRVTTAAGSSSVLIFKFWRIQARFLYLEKIRHIKMVTWFDEYSG